MSTADIIHVVLAALLVVNLVLIGVGLVGAGRMVAGVMKRIEGQVALITAETAATLAKTREALGRVETLSAELERVVRDDADPAIAAAKSVLVNVDSTTQAVHDSVQGVRRVVATTESLLSPAGLIDVSRRLAGTPRGKVTLVSIAAAAIGVTTVLQGRAKKPRG